MDNWLVPRRRGFDRFKLRQELARDQESDRSSLSRDAADPAALFERREHLVHCWRGDEEEALEVGFRGGLSVEQLVRVDEREVLPLLGREFGSGGTGHGHDKMIQSGG